MHQTPFLQLMSSSAHLQALYNSKSKTTPFAVHKTILYLWLSPSSSSGALPFVAEVISQFTS